MTPKGRAATEFGSRFLSLWPCLEGDQKPRAAPEGLTLLHLPHGKPVMQGHIEEGVTWLSRTKGR